MTSRPGSHTISAATMLLAALFVFMALGAAQHEVAGEDIPERYYDRSPLKWRQFSRDTDGNGVDDMIDAAVRSGEADEFDIFLTYDEYPDDANERVLDLLGLDIEYKARHQNVLLLWDVPSDTIYRDLRYLVDVDMVELAPVMEPLLDNSVRAIKARPNTQYDDVWEALNITGRNIVVAILDGGVDESHESLDDLDDDPMTPNDQKFIAGYVYPTGGRAVNPHGDPAIGHGTHVAGTSIGTGGAVDSDYRGVAPASRLVDVKVISDAGMGGIILPAMEWCRDNVDTDWDNDGSPEDGGTPDGIQVMSMSLGGGDSSGDDAISLAANDCSDVGIVVVAAMGNDGSKRVDTPAAADSAIAVAALNDQNTLQRSDDTRAGYSNYGPRLDDGDSDSLDEMKPDVSAPGSGITAPRVNTYNSYIPMDGTSMATPHVSGVVALMLEANPDLTPAQVKDIMHKSSESKGNDHPYSEEPKYETHYGFGMLDAYRAVRLATGSPDIMADTLYLDDNTPNVDDDVTVNYRVRNIGEITADAFTIELWDDSEGEMIGTRNHVNVDEGKTASNSFPWTPETDGEHILRIIAKNVDPDDSDPTNNEKERIVEVNRRPVASITANRTTVYTAEPITFDGSGSTDADGEVSQYRYDFDDGTTGSWSGQPDKEHEYVDDGTYMAKLLVKDDVGSESAEWDEIEITVLNRGPKAYAGDDYEGGTTEDVPFNGTGDDPDGTISLYEWDFNGDGSYDWSGDTGDTTHRYATDGEYNTALRVTDDDGATGVDHRMVYISQGTANHRPHAVIVTPEDDASFDQGSMITFDGTDSYDDEDGTDLTYTWESSEDGVFGTTNKFSTDELSDGSHTITLTVEDSGGKTDEDVISIVMNGPPEFKRINSPEDGTRYETGDEVVFDIEVYDPEGDEIIYSIESDIQGSLNGGTAENDEIYYTISDLFVGYHTITIYLWDESDAEATESLLIVVNTPPVAVISEPDDGATFRQNDPVTFNATGSYDEDEVDKDYLEFEWELDGSFLSDEMVFAQRISEGNHTVTLFVYDGKHEVSEEVSITITPFESELESVISAPLDEDVYSSLENITFDGRQSTDSNGNTISDGAALQFSWSVNDEYFDNRSYFSSQVDPGSHTIELTITESPGEPDEASHSVEVGILVNEPPVAVISSPADQEHFFTDDEVTMDGSGSHDNEDDPAELAYNWYEDGAKVSTSVSYTTKFTKGSHRIALEVIDSLGEVDRTEIRIVIRQHYFTLDIEETETSIDAGDSEDFAITLENKADIDDTFELDTFIPDGWSISFEGSALSGNTVSVDAESSETFSMSVRTASDATDDYVRVTAMAGSVAQEDTLDVYITSFDFSLSVTPGSTTMRPGESAEFSVKISNKGTGEDTISLKVIMPEKWTGKLEDTTVTVAPGKTKKVTLTVTTTATKDDSFTFIVKGISQNQAGLEDEKEVAIVFDAPGSSTSDDDDDDSPGFGGGLLLVAVGAALMVVTARRKRRR